MASKLPFTLRTACTQSSAGIVAGARPLHDEKSYSHSSVKMLRYSSQSRWSMPAAYAYDRSTIACRSPGSIGDPIVGRLAESLAGSLAGSLVTGRT